MRVLVLSYLLLLSALPQCVAQTDSSCIASAEKRQVTGTSMEGIISQGSMVTLLKGFYTCNEVRRNDVVAYAYAGIDIPVIKSARGLPGDIFSFPPVDSAYHCILINGDTLRDVSGNFFFLNKASYGLLHLYEKEYNNIIPPATYLLLGARAGTTDSGRFGMVDKKDLLGKIIY